MLKFHGQRATGSEGGSGGQPLTRLSSEEKSALSPEFKLQLLRAIGAAIVRKRRMYPTQEVLLKHAVHAMHMTQVGSARPWGLWGLKIGTVEASIADA